MSTNTGTKVQPKKEKDPTVFFPVCLLKNASEDISSACYDILCFIGYEKARYLKKGDNIGNRMFYAGKNNIGFIFQDSERDYYHGEQLYLKTEFKFPKVNIEVKKLAIMLGSGNSDFEAACFLAYCALRSIIQTDPYKNISSAFLLSRMLGSATTIKGMVDDKGKINPVKLPEKLMFLSKRYWLEKLKTELMYQYNVTIFSAKHYHKTFYSFHLNYSDLKQRADDQRALTRIRLNITPKSPVVINNPVHAWTEFNGSLSSNDLNTLSNIVDFKFKINKFEGKDNVFQRTDDRQNFIKFWGCVLVNEKGEFKRRFELEKTFYIPDRITEWLNLDNALDSPNYRYDRKHTI